MVQLNAATQTVDQTQIDEVAGEIEIFGLGSDLILLEDATPDIRSIVEHLESDWDIQQDEVEALHEVRDPPIHRQRGNVGVYLLEMRGDSQSKGCPDDVMIFSEVIAQGGDLNPGSSGRVMVLWMRRRARRLQVLSQLRLDGFCDREEVFECKIFYNNILWPEADYAIRQLLDGDAIWVEIKMNQGSARQAFAVIEDIETHARSMQLYGRRQVQQPDEEPDSYTTDGSDHTGRSRSRQRLIQGEVCEAPGSVEDAPWDLVPHPSGSQEGISLLQVAARLVDQKSQGRNRWRFLSLTRLAPPGNPETDITTIEDGDDDGRGTAYFNISDEDEVEEPEEIECGIRTTIDTGQLWKLFQPWCEQAISLTIDIDDSFSALSLQYLSGCGAGWDEAIEEIHIYTDGSYHRHHDVASFAMAIFGWSGQCKLKHHFLGWTGGIVTTDENAKSFVGAKVQSPGDGEVSALIWALLWTLQTTHWRRVHYHFDAMTAGYTANGTWRLDETNLHKRRLRELAQAVEAVRPNMIMFHHEKAHSGQPANELVDGFAKQIIRRGERTKDWHPDWRPMFQNSDQVLTWAWWFFKGLSSGGGLPKFETNGYKWRKKLQCGMEGIKPLENKAMCESAYSRFGIRFATYNAMTLRDKETEQGQRGEDWKAALLRQQFSDHGIHIVGPQETRAGSNGVFNTPDYVRFVSGGKDGHHGCELWVHKGLKIGAVGDKPVCINAGLCTILHADPRILAASIPIEGTKLVIYVLHAPHDGTDENQRTEWWQECAQLVQRYRNAGIAIFLGDLNARFGEPVQGRVGCRTCPSTSKNAQQFLDIMELVDGWLPSTFSDYHSGQDWTWTHPRGGGRTARLDYIAVEKAPCCIPLESWVEKEINTSLTVRDHETVVLDVELHCGSGRHKVDKPRYDWDRLTTEEGKRIFQEFVKEIPDPDWSVDIHVHWQHIENALHRGLAENFPPTRRQSRRAMFAHDTLEALNNRKIAKKILDQVDEEIRCIDLQSGFYAWKDSMPISAAKELHRLKRWTLTIFHCFGLAKFRKEAKLVRAGTKADKARFIEMTVDKAQSSQGVDIFKELAPLRIGGKFRKRGPNTLPGFCVNGEQAMDHIHNEHLWLRHCANMEAGVPTSTSKLLQRARKGAIARLERLEEHFKLEESPTLVQLEGAFRHIAKGKAGGADGFLSNVCYAAPRELAQKYFPVMMKMMSMIEEPLPMKGGILVAAFKGGNESNPEDHRSLLLSSHPGKAIRRAIRQQLIGPYTASTSDTFFSIRPGGNVSHASQALRLFASASAQGGASTGILFLDVKAAYYRVIRQLAVRGSEANSIERVMSHFDLGATELQELLVEAHGIPEGRVSNFTNHQELLLEELLSGTWYTAQHRSQIHESLAGSRPGDGLADLIFGMVFKRILRRVNERLDEALQIDEVEINGEIFLVAQGDADRQPLNILQVVWADDLAIGYRRKGASLLVNDMATITSVVFQECLRHGLIPNLKRGKSEILLLLKGEGSRKARKEHFNGHEPRLHIPNVPADFQWVNLVHTYKHLGTRVHISLKMLSEVKARCGQSWQLYRKHRRQIYQNVRLSQQRRLYLFGSMILPILEFNVGTWSILSKGEWGYFSKRVMALYRGLARADIHEDDLRLWSHDRVLAYLQMPSPTIIIHVARLRYLTSLWRSAPGTLYHLIGAEKSWLGGLHESQEWLAEQLKGYGPDANGHPWTPDWQGWSHSGGGAMKSWIKKAKRIAVLKHVRKVGWREFHFEFLQECRLAGWKHELPWPEGHTYEAEEELEACMACDMVFKNRAAWSVHAFRAHARRNPRRRVIGGTRCDACAREYRSTARLLNHLRHSDACYRQLLHVGKVYEEILPGIGNKKEVKSGPMPIPVMDSYGPREEEFDQEFPNLEPEDEKYDLQMMDSLIDCFRAMPAGTNLEEGVELVKQCVYGNTASFSFLKKTMQYFVNELDNEEMHLDWQIPHQLVVMIAQVATRRFKIPWFFSKDRLKTIADDDEIREAAWNYCRQNSGPWQWERQDYIPRFGCHVLIWVHFFSGERRADDLQMQLEGLRAPPGYVMRILSVDVIFDAVAGNLACHKNQEKWLCNIDRGFVAGLMAGPPCESWSRARIHGGVAGWSNGDGGPKVVRTMEYPEGLPSMTIRELLQTITGNVLLCFVLKAFVRMLKRRRFAMVEHPSASDRPEEQWLASIWKLFMTKVLLDNDFVVRADILQGWYGAKSPKPTSLLFTLGPQINAPHILREMRTEQQLPKGLDMGYDEAAREYSTAGLKNYPGGLCKAIKEVAQRWLDSYLPYSPSDSVPAGFEEFVQYTKNLEQSFNFDALRGADFHH